MPFSTHTNLLVTATKGNQLALGFLPYLAEAKEGKTQGPLDKVCFRV
jgi:hypothetical protein